MRGDKLHLSDEVLLLSADQELSPRREAEVLAHLAVCERCRARRDELQQVASDFSRAHREGLTAELSSVRGSRADLQTQLALLSSSPKRSGFQHPLANLFAGKRWAYVAAVFLVAALGLRLLSQETLQRDSRTLLAGSGAGPLLPEPRLTPGVTRPINAGQVCTPAPPDQMATIPMALRQAVFHEYGMDGSRPREYEVDHLITPELGGTDDIQNLWPEPYATTEWNAQVKDELEDRLRELVCQGKLDLPTAQRDIATNWISAYQKYFHTDKPLTDTSSIRWAQEGKSAGEVWVEYASLAPIMRY
jgi:Putative zinc-finger